MELDPQQITAVVKLWAKITVLFGGPVLVFATINFINEKIFSNLRTEEGRSQEKEK